MTLLKRPFFVFWVTFQLCAAAGENAENPCGTQETQAVVAGSWRRSPCELCTCDEGRVHCHRRTCAPLTCSSRSFPVLAPGACCPHCFQTQQCHGSCSRCNSPSHWSCTECKNGRVLQLHPGDEDGHCTDQCPAGFFRTPANRCQACQTTCKTCYGSLENNCMSCTDMHILREDSCVRTCERGFFSDGHACWACHPTCSACRAWGACDSCLPGHRLLHGKCIAATCVKGTYYDRTNNRCQDCTKGCVDCVKLTGGQVTCLECPESLVPLEDRCVSRCPVGFFQNERNFCEGCHRSCTECNRRGPSGCTACPAETYLTVECFCMSSCYVGSYNTNGICEACGHNCHQCQSYRNCEKCDTGFVLQHGECVVRCDDDYFLDLSSGTCKECSWNCGTCYGPNPDNCLSCSDSRLIQNSDCVSRCSEGFAADEDGTCKRCPSSCKTCVTRRYCTVCKESFFWQAGQCVEQCSPGMLKDEASRACHDPILLASWTEEVDRPYSRENKIEKATALYRRINSVPTSTAVHEEPEALPDYDFGTTSLVPVATNFARDVATSTASTVQSPSQTPMTRNRGTTPAQRLSAVSHEPGHHINFTRTFKEAAITSAPHRRTFNHSVGGRKPDAVLARPLIVSLLHYDSMRSGIREEPPSGYPVMCVSPCDQRHPSYSKRSCAHAFNGSTACSFDWEASTNPQAPVFERITRSTPFANAHQQVLDSVYFKGGTVLRCAIQFCKEGSGTRGPRLLSPQVTISDREGMCKEPEGNLEPFTATMHYHNGSHTEPNRLRIQVDIPHTDSMFPLVSTYPLHNVEDLLTNMVSQKQHVCSNLPHSSAELPDALTFLRSEDYNQSTSSAPLKPHQQDTSMRGEIAVDMYRHLDLNKCLWTFSATLPIKYVLDFCGGSILDDHKEKKTTRKFLTVHVPFYVTKITPQGPGQWRFEEHRSQLEISFSYSSVHWAQSLQTEAAPGGHVFVKRFTLSQDGSLTMHIVSKANFHGKLVVKPLRLSLSLPCRVRMLAGCFVIGHRSLPGVSSHVGVPEGQHLTFRLNLMWSERTFDCPTQLWRATSSYSVKDYKGNYTLFLVPCVVDAVREYSPIVEETCVPHQPIRFAVPVTLSQSRPPVPQAYSMDTRFQLFSNLDNFLFAPKGFDYDIESQDDERNVFFKGEVLYGRVTWDPSEDPIAAIHIDQVFLCAGKFGFTPTYDPSGEVFGKGPTYGCVQPGPNLQHRFLILDRFNTESVQESVRGVKFDAKFAGDIGTQNFGESSGMDGFSMNVDPLYLVAPGTKWYLQVLYSVAPLRTSHSMLRRRRRSISTSFNGTNIHGFLVADSGQSEARDRSSEPASPLSTVFFAVGSVILLLATASLVLVSRVISKNLHRNAYKSGEREVKCPTVKYGESAIMFRWGDRNGCETLSRVKVTRLSWSHLNMRSEHTSEV
ncbi:extracellular matrix organizing protein FRAS1-like isoform X3 [Ornithodoros turicata]|uniref:extracellular matrix organizing protein FRAS1-like isoform X3 n=1 Tax=Ornithodoros turicata TaxID=34597 RepID=UPI0031399882